ncbi:hypothetical protein D3C87_1587580 [compost metagenome]
MNGITENSVIICKRQQERKIEEPARTEQTDDTVYGVGNKKGQSPKSETTAQNENKNAQLN